MRQVLSGMVIDTHNDWSRYLCVSLMIEDFAELRAIPDAFKNHRGGTYGSSPQEVNIHNNSGSDGFHLCLQAHGVY